MEGAELQNSKLPVWIIEYVWAHKTMEIQEVVDPADWPDVDSQPLSLEDSWRLRVTSARVFSIVKNRDVEHFERAMDFLETTYRLLPRLVAPIKHMKIMFGLKTMVIMWMLRKGRGMIDTMFKINQFFPSKLPQYQDHCSQHEMFLMRKNHQDFKDLAQVLTMDKDKLEEYMKSQMEEQYGERYAQKVEDRLVHYLHELGTVLPGDTYIDKILKKESPVTEEEKLLLDVVTSDSTNIATTLKKLLHCDVASCRPSRTSLKSSAHETEGTESSGLSESLLYSGSKSVEGLQFQSEVCQGGDNLSSESDNDSAVQQIEDGGEVEEVSQRSSESVHDTSLPQFCSKHRRWVKSILQECPDECSEELLLQANISSSPPLFQSSTSGTSSSQDLTPSDLIPCPPDLQHPPSETSTHLTVSEQADPTDVQSSGSTRDSLLPNMLSPVVRLVDIASVRRIYDTFKPYQAPLNHSTMSSNKQVSPARTSSHCHTSWNNSTPQTTMKDAVVQTNLPNTTYNNNKIKTPPVSQEASTSVSCQPPTRRPFSKLSRKFRRAFSSRDGFSQKDIEKPPTNFCPPLTNVNVSGPTEDASTSTSQSRPPKSNKSPEVVTQISITPPPPPPRSTSSSNSSRVQLRLSLSSQAVLLQSKLLQPFVALTRLSPQEWRSRSSTRHVEPAERGRRDDEEDADSSPDLNALYSSHSSSNDSEDSLLCDPNYKPRISKKRLFLEYEAVRSLSHT